MRDAERQERIRLFTDALLRHYQFPSEEVDREQWELRQRLDDGEPVDEKMLAPIARRADEARLRNTLRELYGNKRADGLMEIHRSLQGESE